MSSCELSEGKPGLVRVADKQPYVEDAEVSPDHPALAGHFPGNPIVPGAVVLAFVEQAVGKAFGRDIGAILLARFHAPLKPSQPFAIELQESDDIVRFRVAAAGKLIAGGKLRLVADSK
jgi:3-hydroxyacyl-[acyl-carrier-protein] dehydratase